MIRSSLLFASEQNCQIVSKYRTDHGTLNAECIYYRNFFLEKRGERPRDIFHELDVNSLGNASEAQSLI